MPNSKTKEQMKEDLIFGIGQGAGRDPQAVHLEETGKEMEEEEASKTNLKVSITRNKSFSVRRNSAAVQMSHRQISVR